MKQLKFLLVDDHPMFRGGVKQILEELFPGVKIYEAGNARESEAIVKKMELNLIFLDVNLPDASGVDLIKNFKALNPKVKIVMLTLYDLKEIVQEAIDAGVDGYLLKDADEEEMKFAVNAIMGGKKYFSNAASNLFLPNGKDKDKAQDVQALSLLTPAEKKILRLLTEFKSNKEMADQLFVHIRTIENHKTNIAKKLDLKGRNALLKFAMAHKERL